MTNGDATLAQSQHGRLAGGRPHTDAWWCFSYSQDRWACAAKCILEFGCFKWAAGLLQREYVRDNFPGHLLGQGVVTLRQKTAIQGSLDFGDPSQMKGVERSGRYAAPSVRWHAA